jgi:hypothetical protein
LWSVRNARDHGASDDGSQLSGGEYSDSRVVIEQQATGVVVVDFLKKKPRNQRTEKPRNNSVFVRPYNAITMQ